MRAKEFITEQSNLPQRIAILGEANTSNQTGLTIDPVEVTSANEAGEIFGFGSPIHRAISILSDTVVPALVLFVIGVTLLV